MSRPPPPGGPDRTLGLPGNNPRAAMGHPRPVGEPRAVGGYGGQRDGSRMPSGFAPPVSPRAGEKSRVPAQAPARQVHLRVEKVQDRSLQARLIYGNICAVAPEDFPPNRDGNDLYVLIRGGQPVGEFVVTARPIPGFPPGCISLSDPQRSWCGISMRDQFVGQIYDPFSAGSDAFLGTLDVQIGFASAQKKTETPYDEDDLSKIFVDTFQNQVLSPGQRILMDVRNIPLMIIVQTVALVDFAMLSEDAGEEHSREANKRGILTNQTRVLFHRDGKGDFNLKPSMTKPNSNAILAPGFKFEDMGIGGLANEFSTIFRRAFASRVFPAGLVAKMGIPHVKGMLLHGPPGTGKTLIARQIGQLLNARPPKVINGPEVLNKYVGQSEENIRKLFADAEKEYKEKGEESGLHIIIFDELDAVCKQRGSGSGGGTGVGDSVVNQLLSKLDGVDQLNNILLIGMTNRKDMIDDALLRPGRLEVHVEISLPDEPGRLEIFKIHTALMRKNNVLDEDVNLEELAGLTKNFSGAEISGLVKAAASFGFTRHTELEQMAAVKQNAAEIKIKRVDFMSALADVQPAYGVPEAKLEEACLNGIIHYSSHVQAIIGKIMPVVNMVRDNARIFSSSVLLHGPKGSGKTALAAHIAMQSGFPFVKLITPADLKNHRDDFAKKDYVLQAFTDAYKSTASLVILDSFERLIGWNHIGPRFSSTMLEILTTLIESRPPRGHRLLILVTTSNLSALKMLEADSIFRQIVAVPAVSNLKELYAVMEHLGVLSIPDINEVVNILHQRRGSDSLGLGIDIIIESVFKVKDIGAEKADTLAELLIQNLGEA
ncbi:hypothetical protein CP533_0748 [Ophiocordyceps camponoti-saundersi (nom. inval.)]|nr:hypothetical protein CP533_0748 [Ophiocordyceps camponoti-saundersi (nom. inval.)]